jgi:hypothetical protein
MDQKGLDELRKGLEKKVEELIGKYNDQQDLNDWNEDKAVEEANQLYQKIDGMNLVLKSVAKQYNLKYKGIAKPPYLCVD